MGREKKCRILNCFFTLVIIGVGGFAIWYFLGKPSNAEDFNEAVGDVLDGFGDFGNFSDVLDNITAGGPYEDLWGNDPYLSDNSTQSWTTKTEGGLELEILNALDDTWTDEFELAVSDWDNGDPDALTLTTKQVQVDHSCRPVDGVMKVCNGNFGDTGWLGINEIVSRVSNGVILSSVAKMNEYYLLNANRDDRQFTMCHEIGHGFGLPHTDESFTNEDLGNCMDYTNNPENNLHPDETNFQRLASIYGTVDNRRRRQMRRRRRRQLNHGGELSIPEEIKHRYMIAMEDFHNLHNSAHYTGWRVLEEHPGGHTFHRRLSMEYELKVQVLNVLPKD